MSATKQLMRRAALLALETSNYGSGTPALSSSTDGFLLYEEPEPTLSYLNDGSREGIAAGGTGRLQNVAASGLAVSCDLVHYFKGAGAAYSASARATVDRLLRAHAMNATVTTTTGSEKVEYTPTSDHTSFASLVGELYRGGQKYAFKGGYCNKVVISSVGLVVPKWTFSVKGIGSLPTDAAVPSVTYPGTTLLNPKATNIQLSLASGAQTFAAAKVREFTFTSELEMVERANQNSSTDDHAGLALGQRTTTTLEVLFEATALVTGTPYVSSTAFDPFRLYQNGALVVGSLTVGANQYNRFKLAGSYLQLSEVPKEEKDGPVSLWRCTFACNPQTEAQDNSITLTTD